jgi:hypothetical protein
MVCNNSILEIWGVDKEDYMIIHSCEYSPRWRLMCDYPLWHGLGKEMPQF